MVESKNSLFIHMPENDRQALLRSMHTKSYPQGSMIFAQGDSAESFYIIEKGWVKLFRNTAAGDEAVFTLLQAGETFGDTAIFGDALYQHSAQTIKPTTLLKISGNLLREQAKKNPQILLEMMQALSKQTSAAHLENEHVMLMTAPQRVGCLILQLIPKEKAHQKKLEVVLPYDKGLAAVRLGMKPETFSRALTELKKQGISSKGNTMTVSDLERLVNFCCSACSAEDNDCLFSQAHACGGKSCAHCYKKIN